MSQEMRFLKVGATDIPIFNRATDQPTDRPTSQPKNIYKDARTRLKIESSQSKFDQKEREYQDHIQTYKLKEIWSYRLLSKVHEKPK